MQDLQIFVKIFNTATTVFQQRNNNINISNHFMVILQANLSTRGSWKPS